MHTVKGGLVLLIAINGCESRGCEGPEPQHQPDAPVPVDAEPAPVTFAPQVSYTTGGGPTEVALADVDGDGKLDVVVANNTGQSIATLRNMGDGILAPATLTLSSSYIAQVHAGDLNDDGALDLVDEMGFHLNDGSGAFGAEMSFGAIGTATALADLSGDGKLDIAIMQPGSRSLHVVLGLGNATFAPKVTYTTGQEPLRLAVGDVNKDGKQDIVVSLFGSMQSPGHTFDVFLSTGAGTFGTHNEQEIGGKNPNGITLADFNGDGALDVAASSLYDKTIGVALGNGDGTFRAPNMYPTPGTWNIGIASADVNGDGGADLLVTHGLNKSVGIYLNRGDGTFAPEMTLGTQNEPAGITTGDLNGDGKLDIVVANQQADGISVLLQMP